ncbi:sulfotransferase domain-containing protein [Chloroflexi bacterium TSY]|nr:sulfotransferase domain-containing protein [Chloroflexi bacterium TSY]
MSNLPTVSRIYQNHTFDSTRWEHYTPRDGDVVISTSYKSGTTWMQHIVLQLIYLGREVPKLTEVSPWLDFRVSMPIEDLAKMLDAQTERRCIKTHLALDGLPYYPDVNYIIVGRDARDVFMSWWNHYSNYTDEAYTKLNTLPDRVGDPMPRCPQDIREYWRTWISRGWFEWESEGYPHSGNLHHTQSWWQFRHLPNVLFVHFNDLLGNVKEEINFTFW